VLRIPCLANEARPFDEEVDFFAIYIVRKDAWFVLPAKVVLRLKSNIRPAPGNGKQKYARYEAAWDLLRKSGRKILEENEVARTGLMDRRR